MAKLSKEAYNRFCSYLGSGKADDIAKMVESGEMSEEEAEKWSVDVEKSGERARKRRDIEPEEWRDFEDGWRPNNW